MRLEKYQDNRKKRQNIMLITLGIIVLVSVSLLLYKTFASFKEEFEFSVINGKVDYFGNSDVYFAFYEGDQELEEMPKKDNEEDLVFAKGECDNGASIVWDNEEWAPLVKNLSKSKTRCSLYFSKSIELGKDILPIESGDGLYKITHDDLEELGQEWKQTEYRYAGSNPNNYVEFNNEIWRIIGLVNVKTEKGIKQRLKIIRFDIINTQDINNQKINDTFQWYNMSSNDWTKASLRDLLNELYYNKKKGNCYIKMDSDPIQCDFTETSGVTKGLNTISQNMIDTDIIWNLGGWNSWELTAKQFYEKERGTTVYNSDRPTEWSKENDSGEKYNGIGLMYPSDYGYAVGSNVRNTCLTINLNEYNSKSCEINNWLKPSSGYLWTITQHTRDINDVFTIGNDGNVTSGDTNYYSLYVKPVIYLKSSIKILENLKPEQEYGSIKNPFQLGQK